MMARGAARNEVVVRWSGQAGESVISAGHLLSRAAARAGLYVLTEESYGAEVRGGPAWEFAAPATGPKRRPTWRAWPENTA